MHDTRKHPDRRRRPYAPLVDAQGKPVRLSDLFGGPQATALAVGPSAPEPGENGHRIVYAPAFDAYGVAVGTTVVVRPDDQVGRIG